MSNWKHADSPWADLSLGLKLAADFLTLLKINGGASVAADL